MGKLKEIFSNWRVLVLIVLLIFSVHLLFFDGITPGFTREGAAIRGVAKDSAADIVGFFGTDFKTKPLQREVITAVNGVPVRNAADFYLAISDIYVNQSIFIKTNKRTAEIRVLPDVELIDTGEDREVSTLVFNETSGQNETVISFERIYNENILGPADIGLLVYDAPKYNLRQGLDLQGGTRILLVPEDEITPDEYEQIRTNVEQRLNVFGLSDLSVTVVKNLQFQPEYIMIEIAGSTVRDIEELVLSQGKFEAIIANQTVFTGDNRDIIVKRGAAESGIQTCSRSEEGVFCSFFFNVHLSADAAKRQAEVTRGLTVIRSPDGDGYLSQDLELYLDDVLVDSLRISSNLQGREIFDVMITGSGVGANEREARANALQNLKVLQSVIETGSMPSKLSVLKVDTISPALGKNFLINALVVALAIIIAVAIILLVIYRKPIVILPMVVALFSEIVLILGSSVIINWTLDLAAIAGILLILGTGVDHLVVITDGVLKGSNKEELYQTWKSKIQKSMYIVFGAYLTSVVAMLPLLGAGAGLLRGFAITTILGLTFGVFITRPAYAKVIETLLQ